MATSSVSIPQASLGRPAVRAGLKLRQTRERLNLTLRQVERASLDIVEAEGNWKYFVSIGRLNQIENDGSLPSIYKLYSLAAIYQLSIGTVMGFYGISLGKMDEHRPRALLNRTHLFSAEIGDPARPVRFPIRFDPGFRPEKTVLLSRMIELWGEIPAGLLAGLGRKEHCYGYIGLEDFMMAPLLRPGCIVQIDHSRRRVTNRGWTNVFDRPVYFLELRYSYECCWCHQRGRELIMIPHYLSPCEPRTIRLPDEGEILGQVVGVAMRIVQ